MCVGASEAVPRLPSPVKARPGSAGVLAGSDKAIVANAANSAGFVGHSNWYPEHIAGEDAGAPRIFSRGTVSSAPTL